MSVVKFVESLERHKETKEYNTFLEAYAQDDIQSLGRTFPTISKFAVHYHYRDPNVMLLGMQPHAGIETIVLDEEDLTYLYDKYYPRVEEEIREKARKEIESLESKVEAAEKSLEEALARFNAKKEELKNS